MEDRNDPRATRVRDAGLIRIFQQGYDVMTIGTVLLIVLIIALLGGFSGIGGGRFYGTGHYGGGGLGVALVIVLVLVLIGKL